MEIRILGAHNTESLESRMSGILVDDALCLDAGSLTSSLTIEEQLQLSAVLLTHRHYDHIRDIPALGMNLYLGHRSIEVYALDEVLQILSSGFINGEVYPRFTHRPEEQPTIKLVEFRPEEWREIAGYRVLSVSMPHSVPAVGYHVCEAHGPAVFYSGDTGPGFARNLISRDIKPDLLLVEVTACNRFHDFGQSSKHLTPSLLETELVAYQQAKGYLPPVVALHMHPASEQEIISELGDLEERLGSEIIPAVEGMRFTL